MSKIISNLLFFAVLCFLNILILIKWVVPVLNENLGRGYYDAFSLISVLCGNNPDDSVIRILNINNYDSVFFVIFMSPGIIVSWMAFFTVFKLVLFDAPFSMCFNVRREKEAPGG
ncbi:hypothetical protein RE762_004496 [Salmonella enterica]|nr:hypothetical protein [Salmonella enterica]